MTTHSLIVHPDNLHRMQCIRHPASGCIHSSSLPRRFNGWLSCLHVQLASLFLPDMFAIQYMSDLHLEIFPGFRVADVKAEVLVLAGDIGDPGSAEYASFIEDCVSKFKRVFVVLGNHEGYGKPSWDATVAIAREVLSAMGARLLHRDSVFIADKLRIAGVTLWSRIEGRAAYDAMCFISDYRRIGGMTVSESNALHEADVSWLRAEIAIAEAEGCELVVVTHHAPSLRGTSHPKNSGGPLNCAFATDLDHLVSRKGVAAWIFGHTHFSCINGKLVSNQRGYADDPDEVGLFDPSRVIMVQV